MGLGNLVILYFMALGAFSAELLYKENQLAWPVSFRSSRFSFGPLLHQYQDFGREDVYFHEGVDILTHAHEKILAPVGGLIDAGYYSYTSLKNGHSKKNYISLRDIDPEDLEPKLWGEVYFEVSITDAKGYRFEFHHVDRNSLSDQIIKGILEKGQVSQGDFLAKAPGRAKFLEKTIIIFTTI